LDVVGRQAPRQSSHASLTARRRHEVDIGGAIDLLEEHWLPSTAALRHVMRDAGDYDAYKMGRVRILPRPGLFAEFDTRCPE